MDIFEQATKQRLRFETPRGFLTTEDLFDLPLTSRSGISLNSIGMPISKKLKDQEVESLVDVAPQTDKVDVLRLKIIKHIINQKKIEILDVEHAEACRSHDRKIDAIIASKKDQALQDLSIEELQALKKK